MQVIPLWKRFFQEKFILMFNEQHYYMWKSHLYCDFSVIIVIQMSDADVWFIVLMCVSDAAVPSLCDAKMIRATVVFLSIYESLLRPLICLFFALLVWTWELGCHWHMVSLSLSNKHTHTHLKRGSARVHVNEAEWFLSYFWSVLRAQRNWLAWVIHITLCIYVFRNHNK